MGVLVSPTVDALPAAHQAFDEEGRLRDPRRERSAKAVGAALVRLLSPW